MTANKHITLANTESEGCACRNSSFTCNFILPTHKTVFNHSKQLTKKKDVELCSTKFDKAYAKPSLA